MIVQRIAAQEILGDSDKQIINLILKNLLVGCNKMRTLNKCYQTSNFSDNFSSTNLAFADCRSGNSHLPRWKAVLEKRWSWKIIFLNSWFYYTPDSLE